MKRQNATLERKNKERKRERKLEGKIDKRKMADTKEIQKRQNNYNNFFVQLVLCQDLTESQTW